MSAPPGSHDDHVIALALCASFFFAGGPARFHHPGVSSPSSVAREDAEVRRRANHEVVEIDVPPVTHGGFVDKRTRLPMRTTTTPGVHTPRRPGRGRMWRNSLFDDT